MDANLTQLVERLEAVTNRLENVAGPRSASETSSQPEMDSREVKPSVAAFDAIVSGPLSQFLSHSRKLAGDVQTQAELVKSAFGAQREFLTCVSRCKQPSPQMLESLLKPTSQQISAVQQFRENHRTSDLFNHLSAISESIPALGWVAVAPAPGPYVREMIDAGMFFSNRVLKDFKEKDATHAGWVNAWKSTLTELQAYIKQFHTTGVEWNRKGCECDASCCPSSSSAAAGSCAAPPPPPGPPPPPVLEAAPPSGAGKDDDTRAALFADLSKGEDVTKGLRKVTDDMKTHKNPALRETPTAKPTPSAKPSIGAKPQPQKAAPAHPPKCALEGKKWVVEYQKDNRNLVISETEMKQTVYIYKCENCTIQIKGKVNAITLDSCKKSAVVFDEAIASFDVINCQSVQAQMMVKVPTVSIDKTDGCMIYLSKDSLNTQIVTAKSSEMNILVPDGSGDFKEFAVPEQFRSFYDGSKMKTEISDMNLSG